MPDVHEPEPVGLFDGFAASVAATAPRPDLPSVRARARRLRRARWSVVAIASVVALAVPMGVYALIGDTIIRGPASANPSGSPTAAGLTVDTDWRYVTLAIPANETGCAAGTARFAPDVDELGHGVAEVAGTRYRIGGGYNSDANPIAAYGDVDGDGAADAVLVVSCLTFQGEGRQKNPPSAVLLIGAEPGPRTLGLAFTSRPRPSDGEGQEFVTKLEVQPGRTVIIGLRTFEGTSQRECRLRWTGATFTGSCEP
jgi:hypothetical protein